MSTVAAMASSSLNPNAPLFIPAAYRQVEDFSPEWWELVNTTAWFREHWFRQHQLHEAACDAAALLPDDSIDLLDTDDLFHQVAKPAPAPALLPGYDLDVLRALSLSSPRAAAVAARPAAAEVRGQAGVPRRRQGRRPPRHPPASLEEERFFSSCCHHGCCS